MATTNALYRARSSSVGSSNRGDMDDHDEDVEDDVSILNFVWYMLWFFF